MTVSGPGAKVQDLEISVTVHPYVVPPVFCQKEDVDGARNIERPNMNPIGVNLGFDQAEVVFAGLLRNVDATSRCACPGSRLLAVLAIALFQSGAQFGV